MPVQNVTLQVCPELIFFLELLSFQISHRSVRSIGVVVMSGGEETSSQRRDGAGGNQTDRGRETGAETDTENGVHLPPNKQRDSSTMSGAGKTASGVKKTKNMILESLKEGAMTQMLLLLIKRSPTLNCQGH